MSKQNILRSAAGLTLSGIIAKTLDFLFRAYYSTRLGSEGMGLFSLVFSFHGLILTFATAGLGVAVSKTVSQYFSVKNSICIKKAMKISLFWVVAMSLGVITTVCLFSESIAVSFLKEPRIRRSIILLSPSILFMSVSYCIKGYFYAARKILIPASSEFLEQAIKIFSITLLLTRWLPNGVEHGCEAVFFGITLGEFSSCLYLTLFFTKDYARLKGGAIRDKILPSLLKIALPAMTSSLSGSFLRMQEDVLIMSGLRRSGLSQAAALSQYGMVKGMVMPLIIFPLTLLSSCLTLLVPEISRAAEMQSKVRLKTLISRIYRFTAFGGFMVCTLFVAFSKELSTWVYSAPEIAPWVTIIALLSPVMFMDSVSCGILGGMGKQPALLIFSLCDSALRLFLIWQLLPKFGMNALLFIIIVSNLFTAYHTFSTTIRSAQMSFELSGWLLRQLLVAAASLVTFHSLTVFFDYGKSFQATLLAMSFTLFAYTLFSSCLYKTLRKDISWLFGRMFLNS